MNIEFNIRKLSKYEVAEFESLREEAENILSNYRITYVTEVFKDKYIFYFFYKGNLIDTYTVWSNNYDEFSYRHLLERAKHFGNIQYEPNRKEERSVFECLTEGIK